MNNREGKNTNRFYPQNPKKFKGEFAVCRSSWETKFCQFCDLNDNVIEWASEPVAIPYQHPIKLRDARYFPDFLMKCKTKSGKMQIYLVEVKPFKETHPPRNSKKKTKKTQLYEHKTWSVNKTKWKSAIRYCKLKNWVFKIITEKDLFNK